MMQASLYSRQLELDTTQFDALLQHLQHQPDFIYLDSASLGHENNNFSVCVWNASAFFTTFGTQTHCHYRNKEQTFVDESDPMTLIQAALSQLLPSDLTEDQHTLPFSGGAVGYWGYELGGRFERLPVAKTTELKLPDMAVGIYDQGLVVEHMEQGDKYHFFCFGSEAHTKQQETELLEVLANTNSIQQSEFWLTSEWRANMTKQQYAEKFARVQEYLRSGDCYQINLAQRFDADYQGCEWTAYQALRRSNKAPFSSFIRLEQGAVLSVSPERFIQVKDNQIETKPIKGTRPRSADPSLDQESANDLAHAEKDRAENLMIVDLLRNDLSKVAIPGSVNVPKLFAIESFPAVHHLVSTITATLKPGALSIDLLRGAFPGGSITGAPKIRAMEIIHELEPHPRNVYCGAIGYIRPNGDMDTNITIRTLACHNQKIYCWAGGGLVADSQCESEYQETLDKVHKILPVLSQLKPLS